MKESNKQDQKLINKIINVAYGDAGIIDQIYIHLKIINNKEIESLFEEYSKSAKAIHSLNQEEIPDYIIIRAKRLAGDMNKNKTIKSNLSYVLYSFFGKRIIPVTVFGVLLIFFISFLLFHNPMQTHKYSKAEIELAEKQLRESLAIVGKVFQQAETSFNKEVLNKQINKNLSRGYYLVNNILIGG